MLNLNTFSRVVLGYNDPEHIKEWQRDISKFVLMRDREKIKRKIIDLAPRNHAKSTVFSYKTPLWLLSRDRNIRIVIVSKTSGQSEAFLRQIKATIENDDKFKEFNGPLFPKYPEKWSNNEIIVERTTKEKDPTISTASTGGAILSKRADVIICDDILDKENTRTKVQRDKVKEWFNDILMPVLDPERGLLIWVGTVFNTDDLAHELMKDPTFDYKRKFQAIISPPSDPMADELWNLYRIKMFNEGKQKALEFYKQNEKKMTEGSKVLWPERWPLQKLKDEWISSGTRSFNLMYQNDAVSEENAIFKESWIEKCKDVNRTLMTHYDIATSTITVKVRATGVDLAASEEEMANDTAIATVGLTADNKYLLMNVEMGKWTPSTTRSNIKGQGERFGSQVVLVESNAFQVSLTKDMKESTSLPIKAFMTTGEKFDEFVGINSLAVTIENGQWILPAKPDDPRTIDVYEKLKEAMLKFPGGHTADILMAVWFAFTGIRGLTKTENVTTVKVEGSIRKSVETDD